MRRSHTRLLALEVLAAAAVPLARPPAPTSWEHCRACAWTAAWLSARGRELRGPRQLLADGFWRGEVTWQRRVVNQDGKVVQEGVTQTLVQGRAGDKATGNEPDKE